MSDIRFCPHCGENLQRLTEPAAPPPAQRAVVKREVTSAEVERLWGLLPLPFQMTPFGVVVEGEAKTPVALACEDQKDKKQWELARGQVQNLSVATEALPITAPSASPVPTLPATTAPMTVPEHLCTLENDRGRAGRGEKRYGG